MKLGIGQPADIDERPAREAKVGRNRQRVFQLERAGIDEAAAEREKIQTELYEQLGRLQMELAWVKKKSAS